MSLLENIVRSEERTQHVKGGDFLSLIAKDANGNYTGSWIDMPFYEKEMFDFEVQSEPRKSNTGKTRSMIDGDTNISLNYTFIQDDIELEKFLIYGTQGTRFAAFQTSGQVSPNANRVEYFHDLEITTKYNRDSSNNRTIEMTATPYEVSASVTPASTPNWCTVATSSFTIEAGRFHSMAIQSGSLL